jgi:7-cyano-7-deazaguanine synthase
VLVSPVHGELDPKQLSEMGASPIGSTFACSCRCTSTSGVRDAWRLSAVVLLSGGPGFLHGGGGAKRDGFELYALSINYGQRHVQELEASRASRARLASNGISSSTRSDAHRRIGADVDADRRAEGSADRSARDSQHLRAGPQHDLPVVAMGWAEVLGASDIFIGVNALDYSGYPGLPAGIHPRLRATRAAGDEGRRRRPAADRPHAADRVVEGEIIRLGLSLGLDYGLTHSCYDPLPGGARAGTATVAGCAPPVLQKLVQPTLDSASRG